MLRAMGGEQHCQPGVCGLVGGGAGVVGEGGGGGGGVCVGSGGEAIGVTGAVGSGRDRMGGI